MGTLAARPRPALSESQSLCSGDPGGPSVTLGPLKGGLAHTHCAFSPFSFQSLAYTPGLTAADRLSYGGHAGSRQVRDWGQEEPLRPTGCQWCLWGCRCLIPRGSWASISQQQTLSSLGPGGHPVCWWVTWAALALPPGPRWPSTSSLPLTASPLPAGFLPP